MVLREYSISEAAQIVFLGRVLARAKKLSIGQRVRGRGAASTVVCICRALLIFYPYGQTTEYINASTLPYYFVARWYSQATQQVDGYVNRTEEDRLFTKIAGSVQDTYLVVTLYF